MNTWDEDDEEEIRIGTPEEEADLLIDVEESIDEAEVPEVDEDAW